MKFNEYVELTEALDVVAPFYMTADTELPNRIDAAFTIDDQPYVFSIKKFTTEGLYIMDLAMVVGKQRRYWRFKSSAHIKTAIATSIKIVESSIPFLGSQIAAVAFSIPNSLQKSYVKMMEMIARRSYLKQQFVFLPVDHTSKEHQYLLFMRNGKNAKQIFASKYFKDYDFEYISPQKSEIPSAGLDKLKPLKPVKTVVNLEPSKKYAYKEQDVGVENSHHETFDKLINKKEIKLKAADDNTAEIKKKIAQLNTEIEAKKEIKKKAKEKHDATIFDNFKNIIPSTDIEKMSYALSTPLFRDYANIVSIRYAAEDDYSWFVDHIVRNRLRYPDDYQPWNILVPTNIMNKVKKYGNEMHKKYFNTEENKNTYVKPEYSKQQITDLLLAAYEYYDKNLRFESTFNHYDPKYNTYDLENEVYTLQNSIDNKFVYQKYIDISDVKFENNKFQGDILDKVKPNLSVDDDGNSDLMLNIFTQSGYKSYPKIKGYSDVVSYTDSAYESINSILRRPQNFDVDNDDYTMKKITGMMKFFNEIELTEQPMWVWRNCNIPGIDLPDNHWNMETNIVDNGFLSTSVRSDISMGDSGNTKLMIYIPKGSKVVPIFNYSEHSNEKEVILPMFSVLKPFEISVTNSRQYIKCVYIGNGMNDFFNLKFKETVKKSIKKKYAEFLEGRNVKTFSAFISEAKKDKQSHPSDGQKFGTILSKKEIEANNKLIKDGKIKIEKK